MSYSVTRSGDIDILDEGVYAQDRYDSPVEALGDLGSFILANGGADAWDNVDDHEVVSCWLPRDDETEIEYNARIERVAEIDDHGWAPF